MRVIATEPDWGNAPRPGLEYSCRSFFRRDFASVAGFRGKLMRLLFQFWNRRFRPLRPCQSGIEGVESLR